MKRKKIVALVPMRHHSQRVPGKNYRMLQGKPSISTFWILCCRFLKLIRSWLDTDSPVIIEGVHEHYSQIKVLERPQELQADNISMNEILLYDTAQVNADLYLQTHSTNPLLKAATLSSAIQALESAFPGYDSLFSVTRLQTRLYDELGRAINHNPAVLIQTQDLPPVYEENSCIYLFTRENLVQRRHRIGERPLLFEIDPDEAWDIDEEVDFKLVELLLKTQS